MAMKSNKNKNLAGNSFAAKAGNKINKGDGARGFVRDEIPRAGMPGVADIIGQILGAEYDPDIARNRAPGWMNVPTRIQNADAEKQPDTIAGGEAPVANPGLASPRFTSFRELGEHLKRQARGEITAANAGAGIATDGSQSPFEQTKSAEANRGSFHPPVMKEPETIRQLAERLRREVAEEFKPQSVLAHIEDSDYIGDTAFESLRFDNNNPINSRANENKFSPGRFSMKPESAAFLPSRSSAQKIGESAPRLVSVSDKKGAQMKPSKTGGAGIDKSNKPHHNSSAQQACLNADPCSLDEFWQILPENRKNKIEKGELFVLLRQIAEFTEETSKKRGGKPLVIDMTKPATVKHFDFGILPIDKTDSLTLGYSKATGKTTFKLDVKGGSIKQKVPFKFDLVIKDGASFEKAPGAAKRLVNCRGIMIEKGKRKVAVSEINLFTGAVTVINEKGEKEIM